VAVGRETHVWGGHSCPPQLTLPSETASSISPGWPPELSYFSSRHNPKAALVRRSIKAEISPVQSG
jgi:hypothetical protein